MGFALETDREFEQLAALQERIERLCADARSRRQCLELVGAARLNAVQLERMLDLLEAASA